MALDTPAVRQRLQQFDFTSLFTQELGWDFPGPALTVQVGGHSFSLQPVADKRGVRVFACTSSPGAQVPDYATRRLIEKQVGKSAFEHLIIFADGARTTQIWQWVARQPGQPAAYREHSYHPAHQAGDALIQKLEMLTVPLSEEEAIDLTGAVRKLRDAFDRDRVTKLFYERFKAEHAAFLRFVKGITDQADNEWYASLMLNRLMFVYFIQKKNFLDSDRDYLRNRLRVIQQRKGKDKFHTFYRFFLLTLFHEGFAKQPADRQLDAELRMLLGPVPYLNGGLFDVHELETRYPDIDVPDVAFEKLFTFFDQYEWHLDTRPLRNDREINPDVLGYIFEKYINQKQMGAYYTKEDITDYISKNTIIPHLFDVVMKKSPTALQAESQFWNQLRESPDRYIYPAMRKGVIDDQGQIISLPKSIQKGIQDVTRRDGWNRPADAAFALPTETWREHVGRRQQCLDIRKKLIDGQVVSINEFTTLNLDIRQFAEDMIASCDEADLLREFYRAISNVKVLDPTCGSGAFLFAVLGILEPLYESCLDRMQAFVDDLNRSGESTSSKKYEDFRSVLSDVARHPNRAYFIFKSIIVHNLYGVDIMEEAVEICKLRLFLKMVAQIEKVQHLEPLPDIDFNIRSGNTLVGFATLDDVKRTLKGRLGFQKEEVGRIVEEAEVVDRAFRKFHEMQTNFGMDGAAFATSKQDLRSRLDNLACELDRYLAKDYSVDSEKPKQFAEWRKGHQPFHWFAEFFGIMSKGGFDIVVGNPPYVEIPQHLSRQPLRQTYRTVLERWSRDEDLYTLVLERGFQILNRSVGRFGMILPLSLAFSTKRPFQELRKFVSEAKGAWWWSHFDRIPSALFGNDVRTRCTIAIYGPGDNSGLFRATTSLIRWEAECRESLFPSLVFAKFPTTVDLVTGIPKVATQIQADALARLISKKQLLEKDLQASIPFSVLASSAPEFPQPCVYIGGTAYNWFPVWRDIPETTDINGYPSLPARTAAFKFADEETANVVFAILASAMGYWWWAVASDGFNLKKWLLNRFPLSISQIPKAGRHELANLGAELRKRLLKQYVYKDNKGRIGNFYLPACSDVTTRIDSAIAKHIPELSEDFFEDIRSFNASFSRAVVQDDSSRNDED